MNPLRERSRILRIAMAMCALSLAGYAAFAATDQKKASAPAPAKPATAPKPASPGAAPPHGSATTTPHATTTTPTHTGPTANSPHAATTTTTRTTTTTTRTTTTVGGSRTVETSHTTVTNRTATGHVAPTGSHTVETRNGAVTRRADGRISDVHDARRGMDIHHGLDGGRRVSVRRPDGSRLVAERGRRGFVERRYNYHGHDFARRSYYWHGREYDRFYRGYTYHGVFVNVYAPAVYYPPAFYGWAYNPWAVPVAYVGWGWAGAPWYGFYGAYFVPFPVYAGPAFWLADYLIAEELQAAYAAQIAAAAGAAAAAQSAQAGGGPVLTPEVKQEIVDEVKAEIALENAEGQQNTQGQDADPGSSGIARMLGDGHSHVFVAGDALDVVDASGAECALSEGDVLQFSGPAPADNQSDVSLLVLASKGGGKECQRSDTVTVAVADLQEMQNHLRETIDQGLQELKSKQGSGGLPAAPASATAAPTQTAFAQIAPPPDPKDAADVNQQQAEADNADKEAAQSEQSAAAVGATAPGGPADTTAAPATVNIALGQTVDQVIAALGQPVTVVDLGAKKIYKYKDMKITFKDGKVADVE